MRCLLFLAVFAALAVAAPAQTQITASQAKDHIGDSVTVCGKVLGAKYLQTAKGAPTLLDVDGKVPNQPFTIVIFKEVRERLSYVPENRLLNQDVCVTGRVQQYKGKPQIVVHNENQLKVSNKMPK